MSIVGIDFGTTNSVVAVFTDGRAEAQPIDEPKNGEWKAMGFDRLLPSVFARGDAGEPLFGWAAKLRTGRKLEAVKRLLDADDKVSLDGEEYFVEEIASLLFGAIKQGAVQHALDISKAVVTVPANSRGLARLRTKICAGMVGIEVPVLINEPTAAAMAYGLKASVDQNVLVVDWGGGTLDVTLLQVTENVFVEQASKGVGRLGGIDIDKLMFQRLRDDVPEISTWSEAEVGTAMLEIEMAKIRLSDHDATTVALPRGQRSDISRVCFNEWIRPLIERLLVPVRTVIAEGEQQGVFVDVVLLVGGSCKIPAVRDAITELIGKEPLRGAVDPMTAVAEGAAIAAAILEGVYDGDFFVGLEHALGTATLGGAGAGLEFTPVLDRGMKLPAKKVKTFLPVVDGQDSVLLTVWEGDKTKPLDHDDNMLLMEREMELLTPRSIADSRIELEYSLDVSGLLHIHAVDGVDDQVLLDCDLKILIGHDPRTLVQMSRNVEDILNEVTRSTNGERAAPAPVVSLSQDVIVLLDRAREKVIPFVPDDEAAAFGALADALERAAGLGDHQAEKAALESALQRYTYLF